MRITNTSMNKFNYFAFALFMGLTCVGFTSCSDNDKDEPSSNFTSEILGTWQCVDSDYSRFTGDYDDGGFSEGGHLIFFNGNFKSDDNLLAGKKCFILYHEVNDLKDYTESSWDKEISGSGHEQEFAELYTLDGNNLIIYECDLDRFVGKIAIEDGEMTFTYKYQNWNYNLGQMISESKQHTSKFRKI